MLMLSRQFQCDMCQSRTVEAQEQHVAVVKVGSAAVRSETVEPRRLCFTCLGVVLRAEHGAALEKLVKEAELEPAVDLTKDEIC
jgi:hypothetical protein